MKMSLPPRKAFSAVLCSVNVKIPPSSDKTAATAASALIFSQAHNRLPAFLFLLLLFLGLCLLQLAAPTSWFGHTLKGADRLGNSQTGSKTENTFLAEIGKMDKRDCKRQSVDRSCRAAAVTE